MNMEDNNLINVKNGNEEFDESLKMANGKKAEDIETKQAYDDLRRRMDEYNEKIARGEKPDADLSDFANEYMNNFYDEKLEQKLKTIDESAKETNGEKVSIDNLIKKIDNKLGIDSSNKSADEIGSEIDKRLSELEMNNDANSQNRFYKNKDTDSIWWVENPDMIGEHLFSFDKVKIFNLFQDYPYSLTPEQKQTFDRENPYWADFFKDR